MNYCSICGKYVSSIAHWCTRVEIADSSSTNVPPFLTEDFSKFFSCGWTITTLDVTLDVAMEPVPDAFQNAFKKGELEL